MQLPKIRGFNIKRYTVLFAAIQSRVISLINTKYDAFYTKSQTAA
jgi:hypothetical protein